LARQTNHGQLFGRRDGTEHVDQHGALVDTNSIVTLALYRKTSKKGIKLKFRYYRTSTGQQAAAAVPELGEVSLCSLYFNIQMADDGMCVAESHGCV
jgi:hypothetical protein